MVTRLADGIVEAITDSVLVEVPHRRSSTEEVIAEIETVKRFSTRNREKLLAELRARRGPQITREQFDVAVRRALRGERDD